MISLYSVSALGANVRRRNTETTWARPHAINAGQGFSINTNILVVDDHPLFINGLKQYLSELEKDVQVTEAQTAAAAWTALQNPGKFDFIFLDMQLPDIDGMHFLAEVKSKQIEVPVLVISGREQPAWVHNAMVAGAAGFLSKASPRLELKEALSALRANKHFVSSHLHRALDDYRAGLSAQEAGQLKLTRRQQSVLDLIAKGLNNHQISDELSISESTVKGHISTLFDIFNVQNRTSCLLEAKKYGVL